MKSILYASITFAAAVAPASAGASYDRKLEQAVMEIVSQKIGDIRGGFSYKQKPQFVVAQDSLVPNGVGAAQGPGGNRSPSIVEPAARPKS